MSEARACGSRTVRPGPLLPDEQSMTPVNAPIPVACAAPPLCVDLDGTLIASDLLVESFFAAARRHPLRVPGWGLCLLRQGRAALKQRVAAAGDVDVTLLPYRPEVLGFLREQKAAGRRIVLATAADRALAEKVAAHLGLFDGVMASDGARNLKGPEKLQAIQEAYPDGFDYVGDSSADAPLVAACRQAYLVAPSAGLRRAAPASATTLLPRGSRARPILKLIRPHQWIKNALVMLPVLLAHQLGDMHRMIAGVLAVIAFCMTASGIYVVNDLLDVEADRRHHKKKRRPLASGAVPLTHAPPLALALLGVAALICTQLPGRFGVVLAVYAAVSLAYSMALKARLLLDVIVLAGLYTIRLIGGAVATQVVASQYLAMLSLFLFLSLAFAKRFAELRAAGPGFEGSLPGRGYRSEDIQIIATVGPCCGLISILVMATYVNSYDVTRFYHTPALLWLMCPLLLYWITRIWFLANRGILHEDPVVFASTDKMSWVVLALVAAVAVAAKVIAVG